MHLFLAAVAQGSRQLPRSFRRLRTSAEASSHTTTDASSQRTRPWARLRIASAGRRVVRGCKGEADITLFLVDGVVTELVCGKRLRAHRLEEARGSAGRLGSLPNLIALPHCLETRRVGPSSPRRGSRHWWRLGRYGRRNSARRTQPRARSREVNSSCLALGPVIAKRLASGVFEYSASIVSMLSPAFCQLKYRKAQKIGSLPPLRVLTSISESTKKIKNSASNIFVLDCFQLRPFIFKNSLNNGTVPLAATKCNFLPYSNSKIKIYLHIIVQL